MRKPKKAKIAYTVKSAAHTALWLATTLTVLEDMSFNEEQLKGSDIANISITIALWLLSIATTVQTCTNHNERRNGENHFRQSPSLVIDGASALASYCAAFFCSYLLQSSLAPPTDNPSNISLTTAASNTTNSAVITLNAAQQFYLYIPLLTHYTLEITKHIIDQPHHYRESLTMKSSAITPQAISLGAIATILWAGQNDADNAALFMAFGSVALAAIHGFFLCLYNAQMQQESNHSPADHQQQADLRERLFFPQDPVGQGVRGYGESNPPAAIEPHAHLNQHPRSAAISRSEAIDIVIGPGIKRPSRNNGSANDNQVSVAIDIPGDDDTPPSLKDMLDARARSMSIGEQGVLSSSESSASSFDEQGAYSFGSQRRMSF